MFSSATMRMRSFVCGESANTEGKADGLKGTLSGGSGTCCEAGGGGAGGSGGAESHGCGRRRSCISWERLRQ